ncbi:uncharacterized protein LOC116416661 [Nasonia vitripennis]|uniref:RNase H type-1 domain-containing protein n=1 Tax=Nasonia vitripennis TaxID=7425 RepID=A0A7M7Q483_NASVI|nr:uncharacterized protein LOC116416661 [Nasonia vitripennis]
MQTNGNHSIEFNDAVIKESKSVKYLGMILDNTLSWNEHAEYIIAKSTKQLNILKFLRGTWWGGHPKVLKQSYLSLIRSSLEYGLFLTHIKNSNLRSKIQKIKNQAIRLALGYRRSTPINVMHSESKIPHFNDRIRYLSDNFILKLIAHDTPLKQKIENLSITIANNDRLNIKNNFPIIRSYNEIKSLVQNKIQRHLHPIPYDYTYEAIVEQPDINVTSGLHIKKSANPPQEFEKIFNDTIITQYTIFTDASKMKNQEYTGLAMFIPSNNQAYQFKIHTEASIFTAEGLAIFLSLNNIINSNFKRAYIFTDSLSILSALKDYTPNKSRNTSHIILDIKTLLNKCSQENIKVTLIWIPAHVNIKYNETVDSLAKNAIKDGTNTIYLLPFSDFGDKIKQKLILNTQQLITDQGTYKGTHYFDHYYKDNEAKPWFTKINLPREHITTINRIRSNHYNLSASLFRKNIIQSPTCECGYESENIDHILWDCPRFSNQRYSLIINKLNHYHSKKKKNTPKDTTSLLKNPNEKPARIITEYLKRCNLQI